MLFIEKTVEENLLNTLMPKIKCKKYIKKVSLKTL